MSGYNWQIQNDLIFYQFSECQITLFCQCWYITFRQGICFVKCIDDTQDKVRHYSISERFHTTLALQRQLRFKVTFKKGNALLIDTKLHFYGHSISARNHVCTEPLHISYFQNAIKSKALLGITKRIYMFRYEFFRHARIL